jgi:hypothetical protein
MRVQNFCASRYNFSLSALHYWALPAVANYQPPDGNVVDNPVISQYPGDMINITFL